MDEITKDATPGDITEINDITDEIEEVTSEIPHDTHPDDADKDSEVLNVSIKEEIDYEKLISEDIAALKSEFSELSSMESITELDNPIRYAALRDLGLTPAEAYLATSKRVKRDNRSHLTTAYGKNATAPSGIMSSRELAEAREIFGNLGDLEIQRLYKRVTT